MDEIIVARPVRSAIVLTAIVASFLIIGPAAASFGWPGALVGLGVVAMVVWRFMQMSCP